MSQQYEEAEEETRAVFEDRLRVYLNPKEPTFLRTYIKKL